MYQNFRMPSTRGWNYRMVKLLLILLLLVGCGDLPDEGTLRRQGTSVTINYNHSDALRDIELTRYSSSVRSMVENTWPVRHNIKVEPNIADIDLDEDLRAEVEVPIDEPMYVEYTNWTQEEPEIPFMYGKSNEFIVTWEDDYIVKVWVDVELNPDYPYQEEWEDEYDFDEEDWEDLTDTDNETNTDNETEETDNETEEVDLTLWAHYKFEGDLTDSSSYGRDLTGAGGYGYTITYSGDNNTINKDGQAAWFPGNDYVYAYYDDIDIATTDNWTISFWVKPSNSQMDQWASVMSTGTSTSGDRFQIDYNGNGKLRFNGTGVNEQMDLDDGEWQHFVFTKFYEENYIYLYNHKLTYYKNGEFKGNKVMVDTYWELLKIGMNRLGGGPWKGYVDDFRIYKRVLTNIEVKELYESYE